MRLGNGGLKSKKIDLNEDSGLSYPILYYSLIMN